MDEGGGRRRRRRHSEQFKAEAIAARRKPNASIAAAALERSINANLLRRWVIEAERAEVGPLLTVKPTAVAPAESFVALPLSAQPCDETPIKIKVRRGAMTVSVLWPRTAMHECGIWLREVLK
jgi:transposase